MLKQLEISRGKVAVYAERASSGNTNLTMGDRTRRGSSCLQRLSWTRVWSKLRLMLHASDPRAVPLQGSCHGNRPIHECKASKGQRTADTVTAFKRNDMEHAACGAALFRVNGASHSCFFVFQPHGCYYSDTTKGFLKILNFDHPDHDRHPRSLSKRAQPHRYYAQRNTAS